MTVTWGELGGIAAGLIGLGGVGLGALMLMAGGMSDAPAEGETTANIGCLVAIGGAACIALAVVLWRFG